MIKVDLGAKSNGLLLIDNSNDVSVPRYIVKLNVSTIFAKLRIKSKHFEE